jgi:hypothetical protein
MCESRHVFGFSALSPYLSLRQASFDSARKAGMHWRRMIPKLLCRQQPLAVMFRLPAENSTLARFTPDSNGIVFISSTTRVEQGKIVLSGGTAHVEHWRIADRIRTFYSTTWLRNCETVDVAPDGSVAVCVSFDGNLSCWTLSPRGRCSERSTSGGCLITSRPIAPCRLSPQLPLGRLKSTYR